MMAVIKANAYGHGMITVATHLPDVDSFAVARLPEALELRDAGIDKPIVLLAGVATGEERRTRCFASGSIQEFAGRIRYRLAENRYGNEPARFHSGCGSRSDS
jgi:alanine racemase